MQTTIDIQDHWYVLRQSKKQGPYTYADMILQVQKDELMDYQYVWAPHLEQWTVLAEVEDFSKDRLIRLLEMQEAQKDALVLPFEKRICERVNAELKVFAHDEKKFFDGYCLSLSRHGGFFLLNEPLLQPQTSVEIHLIEQEGVTNAFTVRGQIKSKKYSRNRINSKSGLHYVVLFDDVEVKKKMIDDIIRQNLTNNLTSKLTK